jgi:hypothetical protein
MNSVLVLVLLPSRKSLQRNADAAANKKTDSEHDETTVNGHTEQSTSNTTKTKSNTSGSKLQDFRDGIERMLCSGSGLRPCLVVVAAKICSGFLMRSMDSSLIVGYFEEVWKVSSLFRIKYDMRFYDTVRAFSLPR